MSTMNPADCQMCDSSEAGVIVKSGEKMALICGDCAGDLFRNNERLTR